MTSSINLDADWSIVLRLPDAINVFIVQSKYERASVVHLQ